MYSGIAEEEYSLRFIKKYPVAAINGITQLSYLVPEKPQSSSNLSFLDEMGG